MNAQDFHRLLEAPEQLTGLSLVDLQQLALRYPYSVNLRLLLLLKARLEDHPNAAAYLERCAAASFDRQYLYDLLQELEEAADAPLEESDTLELRALDELAAEPLLANAPVIQATEPEPSPTYPVPRAPQFPEDIPGEDASESVAAVPPPAPVPPSPPDGWVASATAFLDALPAVAAEPAPTAAVPPATPVTGGRPAPTLRQRLDRIRAYQQERRRDGREEVDQFARRSLVSHDYVASETLAQLLTRQGQYQHAIKMYRRLILLYPEKKTIFAGLIKDLKEKL